MTITHYAIMAGTFAFIAAICFTAWRGYAAAHEEQDDELASEAEADQRHLTYVWDGPNRTEIKTKGQ